MASGKARGSRPRVDRIGVNVRYKLQTSWNASFVTLDSPEVVILDTCHPRCAGFKGTLPGRRTDLAAAREGPKQCMCTSTGRQSDAPGVP